MASAARSLRPRALHRLICPNVQGEVLSDGQGAGVSWMLQWAQPMLFPTHQGGASMGQVTQPSTRTAWQRVAALQDLDARGCKTVHVAGRTLVLWRSNGQVYALDNRCPHMGFPLDRGTCRDGILTCHWHAARFDLRTGGTFDQFADDVQVFPVEVRGDEVWVDLGSERDLRAYYRSRLHDGLEQDIRLVLAKSAIALLDHDGDDREPLRIGLEFGVRNRRMGWGQGLTMLTRFGNLL